MDVVSIIGVAVGMLMVVSSAIILRKVWHAWRRTHNRRGFVMTPGVRSLMQRAKSFADEEEEL